MMKIEINFQNQTKTFTLVNKNAPVSETFEALRSFATSTFKNLPEDLVFSFACDSGSFLIADPQGLKVALKKAKKNTTMAFEILNEDSDDESFEIVTTTLGVASASETSEDEKFEHPASERSEDKEEDEPLNIRDTEENLEDKVPEDTNEPENFRDRALQFVTEVGTETLQSVLVIAHSLLQNEGTTLQDAIHSSLATCDLVKNKFIQDILPCINALLPKAEALTPMIKTLNIDHWVAMVPKIVELIQQKAEGNNPCELDIRPLMAMMCPGMIQHLEAMIPPGQERVFEVNPNNLTSVLQQAEAEIVQEDSERVRHRGITCDECEMSPIVGPRYKCTVRSDYDLCQKCHSESDPKYAMIKIRQPTQISNEGPFPGLREFARECRRHQNGGNCNNWSQFVPPFCQPQNQSCSFPCASQQPAQFPFPFNPQQFIPPAFQGFVPAGEERPQRRPCWFGRGGRRRCRNRVRGGKRCPEQSKMERPSTERNSDHPEIPKSVEKTNLKEKKKETKAKIHALKREAKRARAELKMLKKQAKAERKEKTVFGADVVDHLDVEERSVQNGGNIVLKTWKVQNTGNVKWDDQVSIEFTKGDEAVVVEGYEILRVDETQPGDFAYVRTMLNVPTSPGRYTVVYKFKNPNGKKFGQKLRSVLIVEEPEEDESEEILEVEEKQLAEDNQSIASAVEDNQSVVEEPEPFVYAQQFTQLRLMGFEDTDLVKAVLVSVNGDVSRALNALLS